MKTATSRRAALAFVFLWFFIGGIAHFAFTEAEMKIVPPGMGDARMLVLVSGFFELLGAIGLIPLRTRRWAGWGLIALTLAVTPANVYMLMHADAWPAVPYWALAARLPLQILLLWAIWFGTRPARP